MLKIKTIDGMVFSTLWENGLVNDSYFQQSEKKDNYIVKVTHSTFCGLWYEIVKIGLHFDYTVTVYHRLNKLVIYCDDQKIEHKIIVYSD